jgi:HK97 family phage major capsid protein
LRAQSSNNNFLGGYAVVPEFSQAIIDLRETYGVFRREARVVPMASDTMLVPRRDTGLTAYFVSENPSSGITESDKSWSQVTLTARKLATLTRWSSELNDDAVISMADDLAGEIAYAFAYQEDLCGFLGDGTSTYGGMRGLFPKIDDGAATASIYTAAAGNTQFGTLDLVDFHGVTGKLPLYARMGAKWYISPAGFADSMERLAHATGGATKADIGSGSMATFLGYPVVLSPVLNSTLTAQVSTVVAVFGNLQMSSLFGDRSGVSIDVSTERYFEFDQLAIRGKQRFDIVNHSLGTTSVAGPVIALKTPAS